MALNSTFGKSTLFHILLGKFWGGYWRICFLGSAEHPARMLGTHFKHSYSFSPGTIAVILPIQISQKLCGFPCFWFQSIVCAKSHTHSFSRQVLLSTHFIAGAWTHQANGNHALTLYRRTFALMKSFRTVFFKISVIKDQGLFLIPQFIIYFCKIQ